jgi:chromosome segregation protein
VERATCLTTQRKNQAFQFQQLRDDAQRLREALHETEQRQHAAELEASRVRLERQTLADRLRDDYEIDLQQLQSETSPEELAQRAEVDREILDLRRRLTQLGAVNMDALAELTDLEGRYEQLSSQYRDLVDAKTSLEKIIQKINADSRKIYADTLTAVRANFQVLFRKVFGGGRADIVLEEDKDILESGVDIVATPPGKNSLNLSLLSGGERALTAVTLLLALFQYRPSPFCVLDEVDGPLDEANIGRFVGVLKEFLQWTRFVVVTHSKKTMTAANTLYGVTMQESGVSKRVSVRFEDVNEQGEILHARDEDDSERGAA